MKTKSVTDPKPSTLPVLGKKHLQSLNTYAKLARKVSILADDMGDIETVVRALIPGGTHELQERVSGDTVRVPRARLENLLIETEYDTIEGWLSGDKP